MYNHKSTALKPGHTAGFTLIEVIVVIAIISILLLLLAPSIIQTYTAAGTISCANNQRQVFTAETHYTLDNNGYAPLPFIRYRLNGVVTDITWSRHLSGGTERFPIGTRYIDNDAVLRCGDGNYSAKNDNMRSHTYGKFFIDVNKLTEKMDFPDMSFVQWCVIRGDNGFFNYSRIRSPGQFPLFADTVVNDNPFYQFYKFNPREYLKNYKEDSIAIHLRHQNQANIGFVDGHVVSHSPEKLRAAQITTAFTADYKKLEP